MVYLKSIIAGFAALSVFLFLLAVVVLVVLAFNTPQSQESSAIGWDPISLVRIRPWWLGLPVAAFAAGFLWEFRRLNR